MRRTATWMIVFVLALAANEAMAAEPELGDTGHFVLSAERLFGYAHATSDTTIVSGVQTTDSTDSFTLFTSPISGTATGYGWPRIAFDGFVARGVSIGGALGIVHVSPENDDSLTGFMVAPRAGYALRLTSHLYLWPRIGFTYAQFSTNPPGGGDGFTVKSYAITLDAPIAIAVAPRVALHLSPTFDLGIGGSTAVGDASVDSSRSDYGAYAGLMIVL
jgi:hypothetical protein